MYGWVHTPAALCSSGSWWGGGFRDGPSLKQALAAQSTVRGMGCGGGGEQTSDFHKLYPHGVCQGNPDYGKCKHVPLTLCTQADKFDVVPYFCI